ncbi:NAD(+) diphosphatase [Clostridium chauvoei]|uniref:NAD(+) diphosphatase n=4 Tax=Clostridium chauvoei TaxID=46867 RepID=S6FB70_9CLOT|nr:NAD(+) diphosphatase [Clostridium chauvoei]ATD55599.1 NADH pyrophosphatase [Clostridium chauvoei]ATD56724.1 NADH pyrophosphatase [Clostridium chauvoei]MBX7280969.1 NAD(+) diphosphatase [Clostridium chauvoei]MBX7283422.1 NAD(+) diphosphatase [Clostridium chauvoei]MBX7286001.1 NAD(+) diphosphatase [Clostridium chauvoei]
MTDKEYEYFGFKPLIHGEVERDDNELWFLICNDKLLVKITEDKVSIPTYKDIKVLNISFQEAYCLGELKNKICFTVEIEENIEIKEEFKMITIYEAGILLEEEMFFVAGRGRQLLHWDKTHKFCGRCGNKTIKKEDEKAKICTECNLITYPTISPAIIVAITKGDEILLAHNKGFKDNKYGIIAGFVDAGEDLETCVKREVFEEVGIKIKNIKYYGSQIWPFPNSLMIGFFAEYQSGEIKVDGEEIVKADWFKKDNFPKIPDKISIARKMIDHFAEIS